MDLWIKSAHVISVISWMVGMLYLPRLMVYHCDAEAGSQLSDTLKVMERRLMKGIMTPAMIATWVFGLWTATLYSVWSQGWFVAKFMLVIVLTVYHFVIVKWMRDFATDSNTRSPKFYRIANEVPALFLIAIVVLVIVKPF